MKHPSFTVSVFLGSLVFLFLISQIVVAFTSPTAAPPGGNVPPPLQEGVNPNVLDITGTAINERDIADINALVGFNDLFVKGNSAETAPIFYGASEHRFYTSGAEKLTILNNGNVGIGTPTPRGRLDIALATSESNIFGLDSLIGLNDLRFYTDNLWVTERMRLTGTGGLVLGNGFIATDPGAGNAIIQGNVGIGTATPRTRLTIRSSIAGNTFAIRNTADTANTFTISDTGTVTSGFVPWARLTTFPVACPAGQFVTAVGGTLTCATPAGGGDNLGNHIATTNLNMSGFNITGANKLTVNTIDPVYEIDGKKYATYVADFSGGVRTETAGVLNINNGKEVIDFDEQERGSDLWLFWKTIVQDMDDVVVILTPGFDGRTWYEKDADKNQIIIYSDRDGEVSYRLTAPREDAAKWPNEVTE